MTLPSAHIDEARLWARHMSLARHGATVAGGVNRQALSDEEIAARRELMAIARELDLAAFTDPAGNFFLRMEGREADAPPVLTGSHIDSQPTGGRFDGIYGVLAGIEAIEALRSAGITPRRPIEVVGWMNEEGSRFAPGMMGSAAFAGAAELDAFLPITDALGATVERELARTRDAFPDVPLRPLGRPIAAYIETHIEQGPVLEQEGYSVGVVTGIQGKRTFRITVTGEEAHAGTAPLRTRRDALLAATAIIQGLSKALADPDDIVKFTVGRIEVQPNAPSVVAGQAIFSIDLRHPDSARLRAIGDAIATLCLDHGRPCDVTVRELTTAMSLEFPVAIRDLIRGCADVIGIRTLDLSSAAGHDARFLHSVCPSGMIFVPCKAGISHNEAESATASDLADGARVLADALFALAMR
jgi:N-carbamoyl-L-amino-acid hydrolase